MGWGQPMFRSHEDANDEEHAAAARIQGLYVVEGTRRQRDLNADSS